MTDDTVSSSAPASRWQAAARSPSRRTSLPFR